MSKMSKIFLALDYDMEGWDLIECESKEEALEKVKQGETCGHAFKILKELEVQVIENENDE